MYYHQERIRTIAPDQLLRAIEHQREVLPEDSDVLDKLYAYLETSRPLLRDIKAAVAEFYAIDPSDLMAGHREAEVALARQIFCYLAYRHTRHTMPRIAQEVGLMDHTTVQHAIRKIEKHAITKPLLADDLVLLRLKISERIMLRRQPC